MRLKEARLKRGLSQYDVAEALSCSQVVYSRYENGMREPSIETLKKLSELYKVSVDYLIENEPPKEESLTREEGKFLNILRKADSRAVDDAIALLQKHPK